MTEASPRPLTLIENALLFAVIALGDDAYGVRVRQRASEIRGQDISVGVQYVNLEKLVAKRLIEVYVSSRHGRKMRYWRPACDLTAVLAAAGEGERTTP